jgi:hypothetical protein
MVEKFAEQLTGRASPLRAHGRHFWITAEYPLPGVKLTSRGTAGQPAGLIKKVLSELLQLQQSGLSR